jgi:hypothetical protein
MRKLLLPLFLVGCASEISQPHSSGSAPDAGVETLLDVPMHLALWVTPLAAGKAEFFAHEPQLTCDEFYFDYLSTESDDVDFERAVEGRYQAGRSGHRAEADGFFDGTGDKELRFTCKAWGGWTAPSSSVTVRQHDYTPGTASEVSTPHGQATIRFGETTFEQPTIVAVNDTRVTPSEGPEDQGVVSGSFAVLSNAGQSSAQPFEISATYDPELPGKTPHLYRWDPGARAWIDAHGIVTSAGTLTLSTTEFGVYVIAEPTPMPEGIDIELQSLQLEAGPSQEHPSIVATYCNRGTAGGGEFFRIKVSGENHREFAYAPWAPPQGQTLDVTRIPEPGTCRMSRIAHCYNITGPGHDVSPCPMPLFVEALADFDERIPSEPDVGNNRLATSLDW